MPDLAPENTRALQERLAATGVDCALLHDEDSVAWLAGYWGYLGLEFGRPTFVVVRPGGETAVVTPLMESAMASAMSWVSDVRPWEDDGPRRWENVLAEVLGHDFPGRVGLNLPAAPRFLLDWLAARVPQADIVDISTDIGALRMIKRPEEIAIMRQAGRIGAAMMQGVRDALGEGVPEYEVALAGMQAGTREAASLLAADGPDLFVSPLVHNLQIMQSGEHTAMVHRRASVRRLRHGDPVYFCFCNMIDFRHYRLGFDRQFFIGTVSDEQARAYETTVAAQRAALETLRPGVPAADVHTAASEVYREAGFAPGYRTGRSLGIGFLEAPELKGGDTTPLAPGMTFSVDGGITVPGAFGARIGDSVVITDSGYEFLTDFPRTLSVVR